MKLLTALSLILLISLKLSAQQFTLSGKITGELNATLFLKYTDSENKAITDSCSLREGAFNFKLNIKETTKIYLAAFVGKFRWRDDSDPNSANLFMDAADMEVTGAYNHLHDLKTKGSKTQNEFAVYQKQVADYLTANKALNDKFNELIKQRAEIKKLNANDSRLPKYDERVDSAREKLAGGYNKIEVAFIAKNPNSCVSAFLLAVQKSTLKISEVKKYYDSFSPTVKNSGYGVGIKKYIEANDKSAPGRTAQNFTATDLNGKTMSLADFKGKYVILDFWASWCVPCRASTPRLIKAYTKYHAKGLDVIAIADNDHQENDWKAAIKKDKTAMWTNVLRGLKGSGTDNPDDISDKFAVESLPTRILVDKDGVIVGRYIGTDELNAFDKKLAEIFGK